MREKQTPHIDAWRTARSATHEKAVCPCQKCPPFNRRTLWLKTYGELRKKLIVTGWRRSWQCLRCLRDMGGDGKNAGPPTSDLPVFITHDDPRRIAATALYRESYNKEVENLPTKRSAWFKDHDVYLKSAQWATLRKLVLERDEFRCVKCFAAADHVHHLTYERWQNEELSDLVSLCRGCHELEHVE